MTPSEQSYREIPLSQGKKALVSAHRYEYLSQFKWTAFHANSGKNRKCDKWYAIRGVRTEGKVYSVLMHREILGLTREDSRHSDHINGDGLDNRDENIRIASPSQNMINRLASDLRGIRQRRSGRYSVRITIQNIEYYIGEFDTEQDARLAYAVAAKILHGPFRHLSTLSPVPKQNEVPLDLPCLSDAISQ